MIRRPGIWVITQSLSEFRRETRLPVPGSFTYRSRFQIWRPIYSSLVRIPVPRSRLP